MPTLEPFALMGAFLPVALGLALLYALLRWYAWTPRGDSPVGSARMHGFMVALIALLIGKALSTTADGRLDAGPASGARPDATVLDPALARVTGVEVLPLPDPGSWTGATALGVVWPVLLFVAVWWIGQHTWPRSTGPLRRGRIAALESRDVVPRVLAGTVAGVALLSAGAVVAFGLSGLPAVPARRIISQVDANAFEDGAAGTLTQVVPEDGAVSAASLAAVLGVALLAWAVAGALATVLVLRRPILSGLHPAADLAVRRVAVNRVLRTALVAVAGIGVETVSHWEALSLLTARRAANASGWDPEGPARALSSGWADQGSAQTIAASLFLLVATVALLWRPPALAVLRSAPVRTALLSSDAVSTPWTPPPAPEAGSAVAVRALRDQAGSTAAIVTLLATVAVAPVGPDAVRGMAESLGGGTLATAFVAGLVSAAPFLLGGLVMAVAELRVRREHAASAPSGPGLAACSRGRRLVLVLAGCAAPAAAWVAHGSLPLVIGHVEARGVDALAAASMLPALAAVVALSLTAARWAGRRGPLLRSDDVEDALLRRAAADRFLASGAGAALAVAGGTATVLHLARTAAAGLEHGVGSPEDDLRWAFTALGVVLALLPGLSVDPRTGRAPGERPRPVEAAATPSPRDDADDRATTA